MSEESFRQARTLMLETDAAKVPRGLPLQSIREVTWLHQRHAIAQGYNSVLEMAFDELAAELAELKRRVEALEAELDATQALDAGR